jgi:hypothetical protein
MSSPLTPHVAQAYQEELLAEARKRHLRTAVRAAHPRLRERFLVRIGELLILAGWRLRERYRPAICSSLDVVPPPASKVRI